MEHPGGKKKKKKTPSEDTYPGRRDAFSINCRSWIPCTATLKRKKSALESLRMSKQTLGMVGEEKISFKVCPLAPGVAKAAAPKVCTSTR